MGFRDIQYDEITKRYDRTRMENNRILSERRDAVYAAIPEFKAIDDEIVDLSLETARKKMAGDENVLAGLHEKIEELRSKKSVLLSNAGYPADYLKPVYTCPDCKDTGYINHERCHCFTRQITDFLYDQSNIRAFLNDNNFSTLSYEYYEGTDLERFKKAVGLCHSLVDNFKHEKGNILFYGTVGTGKSFLSGCIAKELLEKAYSCIYFSAINLFEQIAKETFHSSSKDELYNLYEYIYNCDCLIVDDLGTETTNSFIESQLFALINERSLRNKSTIISTNLSLEDIRDRYSDRVLSRIASAYSVLRLSGSDIRIQKKANVRK